MIQIGPKHWSRRGLMFLIIGIQILILAAIVASQESNRLFDSSISVELEISQALAQKDPFRGASISGRPALGLWDAKVALPPKRLEAGDKVLVFFTVESGRQPRITQVERLGWGGDPPFSAGRFTIPGRVQGEDSRESFRSGRSLIARVGTTPVAIELDLPATIPIDDSALEQLSRPSMVRASLRQGFLGQRYFDNIRLSGQAWTEEMSFTYDGTRDRLVVLAPQRASFERRRRLDEQPLRTTLFSFDGAGKELRSVEVAGRLLDGMVNPADGTFWALVATEAWGYGRVQLAKVGEDGTIIQQGPQVDHQRIIGFDVKEGNLWTLAGPINPPPGTPYFVERVGFGGPQGPRLGPFLSKPRRIVTGAQGIWAIEPDQNRVMRFDRAGHVEQEYRDLNRPTEIAVDAGSLIIIEAGQTQLSKFSMEGKPLWRVPRFQSLTWILPEVGTGVGWVGAQRFEGREGGVFRYDADGKITLHSSVSAHQGLTGVWDRPRLVPDAVRANASGQFYIREGRAIVLLAPDGTMLKRVEGFRYPTEQRVRH